LRRHARLIVREAQSADEPKAADVERLATADLRKIYQPTLAARRGRMVLETTLRRLVAVLDGRVVGTVKFHIVGDSLCFLALGVHPAFRLRGIASALVEQLERIAVDSGCRSVSLHTVRETGNVAIFEQMGFRVESEAPSLLFESENHRTLSEVAMRKNLIP
jgi:GNAT superfamily N-acetyltransferase